MKTFLQIACIFLFSSSLFSQSDCTPIPEVNFPGGRVILSFDGNVHDDDDILAMPYATGLWWAAGLKDKVVQVEYNNHVCQYGTNESDGTGPGAGDDSQNMRTSAAGAISSFGYNQNIFYDCETQGNASSDKMAAEIEKSKASDPLWIIAGGPMETVWRGFEKASNGFDFVTVISHSAWNEAHLDCSNTHNWNDLKNEYAGRGVYFVGNCNGGGCNETNGLNDQNGGFSSSVSNWNWMQGSTKEYNRWLFSRNPFGTSKFDPSDAGMSYFLISGGPFNGGNKTSDHNDARDLMENPCTLISPKTSATIDEGFYYIESKVSGKVLDIESTRETNRANVQQWYNGATDNQKFYISPGKPGHYTIRSMQSNKYVDVEFAGLAPGTNVWQWQGNGTDAQEWEFISDGNGYYHIISKLNGLYLNLENASTANGANITVFTNNASDAQKWKLKPITVSTGDIAEGTYYLESKVSGKVLDIPGANKENRANVQQWALLGVSNQRFQISKGNSGHHTIKALHSNKFVDVELGGTSPGTNVWQWQGNGTDAQEWKFVSVGEGYYNIVSKLNGLYLDVDNASKANGANIKVWTNNGSNAQKWKLIPVGSSSSLKARISPIVQNQTVSELNIAPNPTRSGQRTILNFPALKNGNAAVRIMSLDGQMVQEKTVQARAGNNEIEWATDNLPGGVYLVGIRLDNAHWVKRMIVK